MNIKNRKLAMLYAISLVLFIIRSLFIAKSEIQIKYDVAFDLSTTLIFIGISVLIAAGILILNVNINYFIIENVGRKFCGINLLKYSFKNTLYYIYLSAYCLTTIVSVIIGVIFSETDLVTVTTSLCNYLIAACFLYFELRKIGISQKIDFLITVTIFLGNCLTVLYMLLR